jgi:hypothetical protein
LSIFASVCSCLTKNHLQRWMNAEAELRLCHNEQNSTKASTIRNLFQLQNCMKHTKNTKKKAGNVAIPWRVRAHLTLEIEHGECRRADRGTQINDPAANSDFAVLVLRNVDGRVNGHLHSRHVPHQLHHTSPLTRSHKCNQLRPRRANFVVTLT